MTTTALERCFQWLATAAVHVCAANDATRRGAWWLAEWELYLVECATEAARREMAVLQDLTEPHVYLDVAARRPPKRGVG